LRNDPLWLANMGLPVKLLPQDTLLALSRPHSDMYAVGPYRAWEHLRYAQAVLPGAMELFGVVLSIFFLAYGARMYALLGLGLAGYAAHLLIKVMMFLGEHQHLSPIVAAWFAPVLLLCASGCLLAAMGRGLFGGTSSRV
jgi:lipopolysaccharide export LptBFGC system permease protein LptF